MGGDLQPPPQGPHPQLLHAHAAGCYAIVARLLQVLEYSKWVETSNPHPQYLGYLQQDHVLLGLCKKAISLVPDCQVCGCGVVKV